MISRAAVALILEFEGLDQPSRWPGAQSGITIGHGYDLGYSTPAQFQLDWSAHLTAGQRTRLMKAIGVRGSRAAALATEFRDIRISNEAADDVFTTATLPKWEVLTKKAFPGSEFLPADAFGALVSLSFNRGTEMEGERRQEMRWIRDDIAMWAQNGMKQERNSEAPEVPKNAADLPRLLGNIAGYIREMKRLWVGKGVDGLLRRRDAEAALVAAAK